MEGFGYMNSFSQIRSGDSEFKKFQWEQAIRILSALHKPTYKEFLGKIKTRNLFFFLSFLD